MDDDTKHSKSSDSNQSSAANVIRGKIAQIYAHEPSARSELKEDQANPEPESKHQAFMHKLSTSGKSLADIQTEWHQYYVNLSDPEKRQVWNEFYERAKHSSYLTTPKLPETSDQVTSSSSEASVRAHATRSVAHVKKRILHKLDSKTHFKARHQVHSLFFGFSIGGFVVVTMLFSFFNERFIAPFITPSRNVSSTQIIIDPSSTAVGPDPKVIIPKINVEIPVVYSQNSIDEQAVQKSLEDGVVHYASTPDPGELGNVVLVGHSSNNIFNKGKYKFAFVLLSRLQAGDTFILTKDGIRYVYQVYDKKIVNPTDVAIMGPTSKPATATLITCDPPGTSLHRLAVFGEQISPSPTGNKASTAIPSSAQPKIVPGNPESLWQRLTHWLSS